MTDIFDILEGIEEPIPDSSAPTDWLSANGDISKLLDLALPLERIAPSYNMSSMFEDGGMRTAILCELLGLKVLGGKLGNDAKDVQGRAYELKSVSRRSRGRIPGVSTDHTLSMNTLERYRNVHAWVIGAFDGVIPIYVWQVRPASLEPLFAKWELELQRRTLNNPKIPIEMVQVHGRKILDLETSIRYPRP